MNIRRMLPLCWLALPLVRVAENQAGQTWPAMRRELQRISIGTFTGPAGTFQPPSERARSPHSRPRSSTKRCR